MDDAQVKRRIPVLGIVTLVVLPLILILLVAVPQVARPAIVAAGTGLLFDDFEFTATKAEATDQIGSERAPTGSSYYIVDVQVTNKAKAVTFKFDPHVVAVAPNSGQMLRHDQAAQTLLDSLVTALGSPVKTSLAPNESETYRLVFVGQQDLTNLNVSFNFGGNAGTFLDNVIYGKREVSVNVGRH